MTCRSKARTSNIDGEKISMQKIHVSVRARPLSPEDAKSSPWRVSGNSIFNTNHPAKFKFDRIFGEECRTREIYKARTQNIVAAAIQGFTGTVLAYGQTSSGKTHTMRGSATEPGVIPMAVQDLFNFIEEEKDREFLLRMSYMEIYNEEINDLLAPEHRKLQIHESVERGIFVAGLREEIVASPVQVLELMDFGESHRRIGETNMSLDSSKSHTIFQMIIESREKAKDAKKDNSCDAVRVSVLVLVDLAGSEFAAKTGAEGVRLKEGSHINKSLMTLGTVIKKLSEGAESQGGHVPYRDSKLTHILQLALGGNANTAIICNITLAQIHADETKSSLQFASRALQVTNCVHVNEILTDAALLNRQKKEIEELRAKLQASHLEHLDAEMLNLQNTLLKSELKWERIALELEEEKKAQAEVIKQLQEKITVLEMERSSIQQNLDSVVEIATQLNISAREKHEELYQELLSVKFEAQGVREQLASMQSTIVHVEDNMNSEIQLMGEVQDLMSEFENSRTLIDSLIPVVEELVMSFSAINKLVPELKYSVLYNSNLIRSVIRNHEKLQSFLRQKINVVQDVKILLDNQSSDLHNQIEELKRAIEDSGNALPEISEKYGAEKVNVVPTIKQWKKSTRAVTLEYFKEDADGKNRLCKFCEKSYSVKTSSGVLATHIQSHHQEEISQFRPN